MMSVRQEGGRANQKRRTRQAVLAAATALVRQGQMPSVGEAAEAAAVSRATAYRYFPSQDQLLVEVGLEAFLPDVQAVLAAPDVSSDSHARLDALVRAVQAMVVTNERTFRTMLRLSLESQQSDPSHKRSQLVVHRGGRRIGWLEEALAPIQGELGEDRFRRLLAALALFLGIETQVVLRDVCGLEISEAEDVACWAAKTLLAAALAEASGII